jgi:hypothetical protein
MSDIIGLLGGGTTGTIEALSGSMMYYDAMKNIKELEANRPVYEVPGEVQQIVDLYGEEYQAARSGRELAWESSARQRQQQQTATTVARSREAATSSSDLLGATTQAYSQERMALADLEVEAARQKEQNRQLYSQLYGSALSTSAQYQDKAWNWNEALKYQEEYNKLMGLAETGYETWQMGAETLEATFDSSGSMDWSQYSSQGTQNGA